MKLCQRVRNEQIHNCYAYSYNLEEFYEINAVKCNIQWKYIWNFKLIKKMWHIVKSSSFIKVLAIIKYICNYRPISKFNVSISHLLCHTSHCSFQEIPFKKNILRFFIVLIKRTDYERKRKELAVFKNWSKEFIIN